MCTSSQLAAPMALAPGSQGNGACAACPRPQALVPFPVPSHRPRPTGRLQPSAPPRPQQLTAASTLFKAAPLHCPHPKSFFLRITGPAGLPSLRAQAPAPLGVHTALDAGPEPAWGQGEKAKAVGPAVPLSEQPSPAPGWPSWEGTGSSGLGALPCGHTGLLARGPGPLLAPVFP